MPTACPQRTVDILLWLASSLHAANSAYCAQRLYNTRWTTVSATHNGHSADHTISTIHNGLSVDHAVCSTQWTQCRPTTSIQHTVDTVQTHNIYTAQNGHSADPQHLYSTQWTQCRPTTSIQHRMDTVQTHKIYTTQNGHGTDPQHLYSTQWTQCRPTTSIQHRMDTIQTLSLIHI